jgi:phage/plasmid-associated DNA primase
MVTDKLTQNEQNHNLEDTTSSVPDNGKNGHNYSHNSGEVNLEAAIAEKATSKVPSPRHIKDQHWDEWLNESCVSPGITRENIISLSSDKPGNIASQLNWKSWNQDFGGWWVSGINPITNEYVDNFGQFKPDKTKGKNGKELPKYATPKDSGNDAIFLYDPDKPDFWQQEVAEVVITEGAKKAGAAITQGFHTICLTGVWNGAINKERLVPTLRDYIRSQPRGLRVNLCFDADLWSNRNVGRALLCLGDLLEMADCKVTVTDLSAFGKKQGIDDVIATRGVEAFREALENAYPFSTYYELVEKLPLSAIQEGFQHLYDPNKWIKYDGLLHWWNGQYFEPQSEAAEMSRIRKWCKNFRDSIFQDYFQDKEGLYDTPHSKPSMPGHIYKEALDLLYVDPERVNPSNVLNLSNAVLELEWGDESFTRKVYDHDPANHWKFTYVSDVAYDEAADPTWCDQLLEAIPVAYRDILLKNLAASLDLKEVRNRVGDEVRSIILYGYGSNGKDAIRAALFNIFSDQYLTSVNLGNFQAAEKSGRGFTLVPLLNSKINWASENNSKLPIDQLDSLKNVISGDSISIERKNVDQTRMEAQCICLFNTNYLPNLKGYDFAIQRRITVVEMPYTFKKNPTKPGEIQGNPNFKNQKWLAEYVSPALLNTLLVKLDELLKYGVDYDPVAELMGEINRESDHFIRFAQEVGIVEDPEGAIPTEELWFELRKWYAQEGLLHNGQTVITEDNDDSDNIRQHDKFDEVVTSKEKAVKRALKTFKGTKRGQTTKEDGSRTRAVRGIKLNR